MARWDKFQDEGYRMETEQDLLEDEDNLDPPFVIVV